ncbi:MAG: sigma-54 dependent transcriptional regulator [bacterium]
MAKSKATVLILGESGTGKELVAKAIHSLSDRSKNKFIDLNCGAIPKELLENELFGHEKGAYTSADRRYIGSFERANGGTLFLDEICEMDLPLQVKLLRVLQERSFLRIGGSEKIDIDVRIVAATNRNIQEEVHAGRFREDLYYRLNVVPIVMPPLRERREDIPLLAKHFLNIYSSRNDKLFIDFHPDVVDALMSYDWPGNVRELENVIERVIVLHNDSQVKMKHLPDSFQGLLKKEWKGASSPSASASLILPLKDLERRAIEQAMKKYKSNIGKVAKALEIGQATLYRKLNKYKLKDL